MENKLAVHTESCVRDAGSRFLALLLSCALIFTLSACGGQKGSGKAEELGPVTVEREPEPQALQTANEATAIALRQYVYARLLTEAFMTVDTSNMTAEKLSEMADELLLAWENAELFSSTAMELTNQAVLLLEMPTVKQTSAVGQPQISFMTLAAVPTDFQAVALATSSPRQLDPQTWAENLTRQYDALKGAKRYQQLAQQLGTDAKTAYEQMALAQKIIRNAAELEEAEGVVNAYTDSIHYLQGLKTTSKVAMLGWSMAATGGGSVTLLEGSGLLMGGVDCIVDVTETGSTLILGENNQVTVAFGDIKEKLGPVSSLIGLVTLNPSGIGNAAKDTTEALIYVTDSLVDLFYEGKVMGIQVSGGENGSTRMKAQILDTQGKEKPEDILKAAGFTQPDGSKSIMEIIEAWKSDLESIITRMDELMSEMEALPPDSAQQPEEAQPTPGVSADISGTYVGTATTTSADKSGNIIEIKGPYDYSFVIKAEGDKVLYNRIGYEDSVYELNYSSQTGVATLEKGGGSMEFVFDLSASPVTVKATVKVAAEGGTLVFEYSATKEG